MATLKAKMIKGNKYWYIVESRRINGKPKSFVLKYLGKAEALLMKLEEKEGKEFRCKSYSHGAVAVLLKLLSEFSIIDIINKHLPLKRGKEKQIRDDFTVGASLALRTIEKVCNPCSNREFFKWVQTTSLEYLLRISCKKMDSQHFWDQMNELPSKAIPKIEEEIIQRVIEKEKISLDILLFDATNFFTFIATDNSRCTLAERGKSKQGRGNLRQVGLLLVVSRKELVPLFHQTYIGNKPDSKVFSANIGKIMERITGVLSDLEDLTLVFDRGNNSKSNLTEKMLKTHYVGALTPNQHGEIMKLALTSFSEKEPEDSFEIHYRNRQNIWGEDRTLVVYRSEELYKGLLRGIETDLSKVYKNLKELNENFAHSQNKNIQRKEALGRVEKIIKGKFIKEILSWELGRKSKCYSVKYHLNEEKYEKIKREKLGYRILMTDRHDWSNEEIKKTYHCQSKVEYAFRNIKNPFHISIRPQYHWTDQKIRVHVFTCVLAFLLESIIYKRVQAAGYGTTNYDNLLDKLNQIRLVSLIQKTEKKNSFKAKYQLEEVDSKENFLLKALEIKNIHDKKIKIPGVNKY